MFNKSINLLSWLFPKSNCNIICDTYYEYGLSLIKNKYFKMNNNKLMLILEKSLYYANIFYEKNNREKYLKIYLIYEYENIYSNITTKNFDNIVNNLKELNNINKKETEMFIKLFEGLCKGNKKLLQFYNELKINFNK
jgi:hypothetical protein